MTNRHRQQLTRQELYEAIWREPMRRVAQRLGVSDVALSKACRRHSIPVPGRGYWAQLAVGKAPARPELPELEGSEYPVVIRGTSKPAHEDPPDTEVEQAVAAHVPAEPIAVPHSWGAAALVVRRTVKALKRAKPDERGLRRAGGRGLLHLAVTDESVDRAARIADALVRTCQGQGLMSKTRAADGEFAIQFQGQSIRFSITEAVTRTERTEPPAERRQRERAQFSFERRPQYEYHPTGRLTFRFDGYGNGHRVSWGDGKTQRLEDLLSDIIAGSVRLAIFRRRQHEEIEARRRSCQEAERLRRDRYRQDDDERQRCERLMMGFELWKMAVEIRQYVASVEEARTRDDRIYEAGSPEAGWIQWASWVADQLDPTSEEPLYHATLDALWHVRSANTHSAGPNPLLELLQ